MRDDPTLAVKRLPPGDGYKVARTFRVEGGLHYIKGNGSPHFSLTYWAHRAGFPNQCESGGAGHKEILKHFPRFADLAALHLCDIDGAPMHAVENGWYSLAGALDGFGTQYHAGNSKRNFPCEAPADKPWQTTEYREPTADECLQIFAEHCRIDITEARRVKARVWRAITQGQADQRRGFAVDTLAAGKAVMREELDNMRPRWKAEAAACVENHKLRVYGDAWQPQEAAA